MKKEEIMSIFLTALTKISEINPQVDLRDKTTKESIAKILLEEIEKKGLVEELANKKPDELQENVSETVLIALNKMMEEIKNLKKAVEESKEEIIKKADEDHNIIRQNQINLAEGIKAVIRGQGKVAKSIMNVQKITSEAIIDVVRQEGEYTRKEVDKAKEEIKDRISDQSYYRDMFRS